MKSSTIALALRTVPELSAIAAFSLFAVCIGVSEQLSSLGLQIVEHPLGRLSPTGLEGRRCSRGGVNSQLAACQTVWETPYGREGAGSESCRDSLVDPLIGPFGSLEQQSRLRFLDAHRGRTLALTA